MKYLSDYDNTIEYAKKESLLSVARNMKRHREPLAKIIAYTKLPKQEIAALS